MHLTLQQLSFRNWATAKRSGFAHSKGFIEFLHFGKEECKEELEWALDPPHACYLMWNECLGTSFSWPLTILYFTKVFRRVVNWQQILLDFWFILFWGIKKNTDGFTMRAFFDITFQKVKWKKKVKKCICSAFWTQNSFCFKVDSSKESAEAACDILSQLVNCSLKTLGLISTARPSFMDLPKVFYYVYFLLQSIGVFHTVLL